MHKNKKNYTIYFIMMLLFGILIYGAITEGERFSHLTVGNPKPGMNSFDMFRHILETNLRNPVTILLLQIIVILITVRLFSHAFKYINQPGVIGEIVAGIALGPSLAGYFFPEFTAFIFPSESLHNLELFSQIGLVLFMFVIGMELDFGMLKNKMNETLVISHAGIVVPFFLGIITSYWVYEVYASSHTPFLPFALFMGISMSITAFPVLARIVQERNMTKTPTGILALASAANDDVTAWCLLAVVIAIAKAGTVVSALFTILLTCIYILAMFFIIKPFLKKIGNLYANKEVINKSFVGFIFLILIASSMITEIIGIHALFGAFMAGVVMPGNMGFRKVMMEKVEDVAMIIFLPLFFAYTGLNTQIGLINSSELWIICLLFIFVSVAGKFGGCAIAARCVGETWKDSLVIGSLMNTRGLMELIALNIGREMGILPPEIFAILVIMALSTTFMTTPLLSMIERAFAQKKKTKPLYKKIILCFGRPESGRNLLSVARILFGKQLKQMDVVAAHYTLGTDLNPVKAEQYSRESFAPILREASRKHIRIDKRYKVTDRLNQEIVKLANGERNDLLLLGAGPRFMTDSCPTGEDNRNFNIPIVSRFTQLIKEKSMHLPGSLLREKLEWIINRVNSPVAIYENRDLRTPNRFFLLLNGDEDIFMLQYLESIFTNGVSKIKIMLTGIPDKDSFFEKELKKTVNIYRSKIKIIPFFSTETKFNYKTDLLFMSYRTCIEMAADYRIYDQLPSFLTIRPEVKKNEIE
ncbi:cation:proton antiporter [Coprobacter sp.]